MEEAKLIAGLAKEIKFKIPRSRVFILEFTDHQRANLNRFNARQTGAAAGEREGQEAVLDTFPRLQNAAVFSMANELFYSSTNVTNRPAFLALAKEKTIIDKSHTFHKTLHDRIEHLR